MDPQGEGLLIVHPTYVDRYPECSWCGTFQRRFIVRHLLSCELILQLTMENHAEEVTGRPLLCLWLQARPALGDHQIRPCRSRWYWWLQTRCQVSLSQAFATDSPFDKNHSYAPGVVPQTEAAKEGYSQNLWLLGPEHALTEVGTMNLFVAFKKPDGCESFPFIFALYSRNKY